MHNVTGHLRCFFSFVCRTPQVFKVLLAVMITTNILFPGAAFLSVRPASWTKWIQFTTSYLHQTLHFGNYSHPFFAYYTIMRLLLCPWLWPEAVETLKVDVLIKVPLSRTDSTHTPIFFFFVVENIKLKIKSHEWTPGESTRHHQNGLIYYGSWSRAVSTESLSWYWLGPCTVGTWRFGL